MIRHPHLLIGYLHFVVELIGWSTIAACTALALVVKLIHSLDSRTGKNECGS